MMAEPRTSGGGSPLEPRGSAPLRAPAEPSKREEGEGAMETVGAEETKAEDGETIDGLPDEPPPDTDAAEPIDSPDVGGTVALSAGVVMAAGAGLAPPAAGASGAASRAGATPKPRTAISTTATVHHVLERPTVMIGCFVAGSMGYKSKLRMAVYPPYRQSTGSSSLRVLPLPRSLLRSSAPPLT